MGPVQWIVSEGRVGAGHVVGAYLFSIFVQQSITSVILWLKAVRLRNPGTRTPFDTEWLLVARR